MSSALENEDLDNVPLVRMEDVQPSRERLDRAIDTLNLPSDDEEIFETCIIDKVEYENDCGIGEDSDSNIGSMVSIQSEEVIEEDEVSDSGELIVPEVLDPPPSINVPLIIKEEKVEIKQNGPDSWPTLEILPGGVIKNAIDCDSDSTTIPTKTNSTPSQGEMMYACAKCSQAFKYLFCLVKHVKWHDDQKKLHMDPKLRNLTALEGEMVSIKRERHEFEKTYKRQKLEVLARIAAAIGKMNSTKDIFNK